MSARRPSAETLQLIEALDTELRAWQAEERAIAAARWAELEPIMRELRELSSRIDRIAAEESEAAQ